MRARTANISVRWLKRCTCRNCGVGPFTARKRGSRLVKPRPPKRLLVKLCRLANGLRRLPNAPWRLAKLLCRSCLFPKPLP
jgi:hypothetical protein